MKLCGLNIPYEYQYREQVTSNRIHNTATDIANPVKILTYDNLDIAGTLHSTANAAQGIWEAVQQGKFFDIEKKPIDSATVKQELNILSVDLQKIAEAVQTTLKSEAEQKRWPEEAPLISCKRLSILDEIKALSEMSQKFKIFAETLPD